MPVLETSPSAVWAEKGFLPRIPVLDSSAASALRAEFDRLEAREGRERCAIGLIDRHFDLEFVWRVATHEAILNAVEAVMGPDIMLLATHFFCKYPREGEAPERFVAWHQDVTYWGLEPPFALTAWYAVDDSDAENGCMRVIPGSHAAVRDHGFSARQGNLLSINQEVPVTAEEEASAVDLPLRAGECSLHHGRLIHGSNPNRSPRRRCGLTIRFIPPDVRQLRENSMKRPWKPILVRGTDAYRHYPDQRLPFPIRGAR
jgi:ectoine hydroxylase-related dioxygenase (phytanoyl-CoA dioxygenase family)